MKFLAPTLLLFCICCAHVSTAQQITVTNSTCPESSVCLPGNQAQFLIPKASLTFDPNDGDPKRRFQAFWITGDGNYLQFKPEDDLASMAPVYNYPTTGTFETTAYLTGRYTNRKPPARTAVNVPITTLGATAPQPVFNARLGKLGAGTNAVVDIFSNHAIRKKNLTAFVVSWPAAVQATGVYFFFNGFQNHMTREEKRLSVDLLKFSNAEVPKYFAGKMDATKIRATSVVSLRLGGIPGLTFNDAFVESFHDKFGHVLYFPPETATPLDMPRNFTESRYFPVLWTDSLLIPDDTLLNFYVLITGDAPVSSASPTYFALDSMIGLINPDLGISTPFSFAPGATGGPGQPQYIQAVATYQIPYLATFDPNQLTVEHVKKLSADEYEVTMRLEMCNKGRGDVFFELIDIGFSPNFQGFQALDFTPENASLNNEKWSFRVTKTITGVPELPAGQHEESVCESIRFNVKTNCEGLRSLWKGSEVPGLSACVVFEGAMSAVPECHGATRIDSTQYQENGECFCCRGPIPTEKKGILEGCDCGLLCMLLIAVVVLVLGWWAFIKRKA